MAKKKTTPKFNTVTPVDQVRLGTQVAGVKASTTPQQWRQIVKLAHSRGYTLAGALSDSPDALKPRLQSSLRSEAQKQTAEAYKPVTDSLDSRQRQVVAWDQKRKDDNQAYASWLATVNQGVDTQSQAAVQTLGAANTAARDGVSQAWNAIQSQTKANTAGGVSDPGQSSALAQVGNARAASEANAQTAFDTAANKLKNDTTAGSLNTQAINAGFLSQADASRRADVSQALQSLTDDRTKVKLQQSADYLSAFSKLKDNEITKAQYLSDSDIARQKLLGDQAQFKLDTKKVNHDIATDARGDRVAQQNADTSAAEAQIKKGQADVNSDGVIDQKDYELKQQITARWANKGGAKGPGQDAKSKSTEMLRTISFVKSKIVSYNNSKKYKADPRGRLNQLGYDDIVVDVAQDLINNDGKLSKHGREKARLLGILNPEKLSGL